jgi:hypothetical protein
LYRRDPVHWRRQIIELATSELNAQTSPAPSAVVSPAIVETTGERPESRMQKYERIQELVRECDYRGPVLHVRAGCSCEIRHCGLGKGSILSKPSEVDLKDCFACVTDWRSPSREESPPPEEPSPEPTSTPTVEPMIKPPFNQLPPPRKERNNKITIRGALVSWTGYGRIAEMLGRGLEARGVSVNYEPTQKDPRYHGLPEFVTSRIVDQSETANLMLLDLPSYGGDLRTHAHFSMWEVTGISEIAVSRLNRAKLVIVPCAWNAACFSANGVTAPIRIVPLGVDIGPGGFPPQPPPNEGPFRFGVAARMAHGGLRKGVADGVDAFLVAFPSDPDVRLEIKLFPDCEYDGPKDHRVIVNREPMNSVQMANWYRGIDVLFVPSKGEGWGMHTHEAMACGRPVIASLYGGTAEFVDRSCAWPLDYTFEPAGEFYVKDGGGHWIVPTKDSMVRTLRHVRTLRGSAEYWSKAATCVTRAREFTWERSAKALHDALIEAKLLDPDTENPHG